MYSLAFTNNKQQSIFFESQPENFGTQNTNYMIESVSGLSDYDIILPQVKGYNQIGYTLQGVNAGVRIITIGFYAYTASGEVGDLRRYLCSVLNPTLGQGVLRYRSTGNQDRYIDAIISQMPKVEKILSSNLALFKIEFTCHNPLWYSAKHSITEAIPSSATTYYNHIIIPNNGDVEAPFKLEFEGPGYLGFISLVNNPGAANEKILHQLRFDARAYQSDSESLYLTTEYGNKNLYIVTNNGPQLANRYITMADFFGIPVGDNTNTKLRVQISIDPQNPHERNNLYITWNDWFVGV